MRWGVARSRGMRDEKSEVWSCQILGKRIGKKKQRKKKTGGDKKNSFSSFSVDGNYGWNRVGGKWSERDGRLRRHFLITGEKMKVDEKRGETRAESQEELSCPVDRWQPERRWKERFIYLFFIFLPSLCYLPLPLLAVWPALTLPLGLIKQTVGSTRSGGIFIVSGH